MQDILLLFITILLIILVIELSVVLYYAIVIMQDAIIIVKRIRALECDLEEKLKTLENDLTIASGKIIKGVVRSAGKFLKK